MSEGNKMRTALAGGDVLCFAPLVWHHVPEFLGSSATVGWRRDAKEAQGLLTDAGAVCGADALLLPLPDSQVLVDAGERAKQDPQLLERVTSLAEIASGLALTERMRRAGRYAIVALLPTLEEFAQAFPQEEPEDLEDGLRDVARESLEAGAVALALVSSANELTRTVTKLGPISDYFGTSVLAIQSDAPWVHHGNCDIGLVTETGQWPSLTHGIVTTAGDVSEWWTPQQTRRIFNSHVTHPR